VVKAITKLMETEEAYGDIFNIGGNQEVQIRDLAKKIIELTGSKSKIKYIPYEKVYSKGFEDMKRRIPDISKIHNLIGWQPKVDLDQLLKIVIDYERSVLGL
ncbi:MAG: GDP-mannose 4,6-dehydratase, partial [Candidatus Poribacteria bacterium]